MPVLSKGSFAAQATVFAKKKHMNTNMRNGMKQVPSAEFVRRYPRSNVCGGAYVEYSASTPRRPSFKTIHSRKRISNSYCHGGKYNHRMDRTLTDATSTTGGNTALKYFIVNSKSTTSLTIERGWSVCHL